MIFDLVLLRIIKNKNSTNINLSYFLLYPFILISLLFPLWAITNSLLGVSWRMGFPLYSNTLGQLGVDPHVFGPAMACASICLTYIFFNLEDYYKEKNKLLFRVLLVVGIISCISAALFCGSRGGILILLAFSISYFSSVFLKNIKNNNFIFNFKTRIKKSKLLVLSVFSIFFIISLNFISNASDKLSSLIVRSFSILPVLTGADPSRSSQLKQIKEVLSSSYNDLFSRDYIFPNADVGPKFFIYNQGLILFLLFIVIYVYLYLILMRLNIFSASIFIAGLLLLFFASATLLIPRFYVIYFYSLTILASRDKFRQIPK